MDDSRDEGSKRFGSGGRLARWYTALAVIVFNILVLLAVINIIPWAYYEISEAWKRWSERSLTTLRWNEYDDALAPVYPHMERTEALRLRKETRRLYQGYEQGTQFRELPYTSKYVNVTPAGYRMSGNQGAWPPPEDQTTVFFFGGSTTFGYGVGDEETVPSHFQRIAAEQGGEAVKAYNFGRSCYLAVQERTLLEKYIAAGIVPDVAIFIDGLNELIWPDGVMHYTAVLSRFMAGQDKYCERALLARFPIIRALSGVVGGPFASTRLGGSQTHGREDPERFSRLALDRYARNMRLIEAICEEYKIVPVFVWQPIPVYGYDLKHHLFADYDYDGFAPCMRVGYALMAERVKKREMGQNFLWFADIQKDIAKPIYVSNFHYSAEMSEFFARALLDEIKDRGLMPDAAGRRAP